MDKQDAIKHLRKRLLVLLSGLALSYAISFGVAIFLFIDADIFETQWGWPIIAGLAVLAFVHLRAQFRRYDALVRMAEGADDDEP